LFWFDSSTFVCPTELVSFSDHIDEFKKIGVNVVGCSCDSHFSHLAFVNTPRKVSLRCIEKTEFFIFTYLFVIWVIIAWWFGWTVLSTIIRLQKRNC
jgi:hypothetical protein